MMRRFYASCFPRSSQWFSVGMLLLLFSTACGPRGASNAREPSEEVLALHAKAEAAELRREHESARSLYKQAIQRADDPVSAAYANREMASMLIFWGELEAAAPLLEASLRHDATQVPVWHDLGVLQSQLGRLAQAEVSLGTAVKLSPEEPRARIAFAAVLMRLRKFSAARLQYKALLALEIPPKIRDATIRALGLLDREIGDATK